MKSLETDEERQQRLAKQKVTVNQKSQENAHGTMRIAGISNKQLKTKSKLTQNVTKQNLAGSEKKTQDILESLNLAESEKKTQESRESLTGHCVNKQTDSLIPITENKHMFNNIDCFHNSNEYKIKQCTVCLEAWPKSSSHSQKDSEYQCVRCSRDKKHPQKFSKQNYMVPSAVPSQLQGLTQIEEMLIARALPIMRVYIKPGGQRGYSGHCINLPQHVQELATSLPRYPKDLALIVIKMKGKDNTFKDVTVRRRMVQNALTWLINNNPHYQDVHLNQQCLASLPENSIPNDLISIERENDVSESSDLNFGPQNEEEIIYNEGTQVNTFLPIPECKQQEIDAIQQKLSSIDNQHIAWPTVDNEPMNEYLTPFLATMAFPTLFPDGKGDPTNPSLNRDVQFGERIKHLLKYAEKENGTWLYRFASHPRFAYWALNMIQRKRILQQTGIFLKQNPGEAHLTTEDLQQMAAMPIVVFFFPRYHAISET